MGFNIHVQNSVFPATHDLFSNLGTVAHCSIGGWGVGERVMHFEIVSQNHGSLI